MIFRILMVFGVLAILSDYAWTIAIFIYGAVLWFSFKTSDQIEIAKEQGVVGLQPQLYPDMPFHWNVAVRSYMRDEITADQLDQLDI